MLCIYSRYTIQFVIHITENIYLYNKPEYQPCRHSGGQGDRSRLERFLRVIYSISVGGTTDKDSANLIVLV